MGGTRGLGLGIMLAAVALAGCGTDQAPAPAAETQEPATPAAVPWEVAERILAAQQGEYTVRVTGIATGGDEVLMRSETHRYDLDAPFMERTIHGAGDPFKVVYADQASFMWSEQWEAACGTPWLDMTAVESTRSTLEQAAAFLSEPVVTLESAVDEPRLVRAGDGSSVYEITLPGPAGLPPFPDHPDVVAALSDDERVAMITVPAGTGPLEVELEIDLSEVEDDLDSVEPGSSLLVRWAMATEFEPVDTALPTDAADPACAE